MKGVYALTLSVDENVGVRVGALGALRFRKGTYVYVGSAQNGLEARIRRHAGKNKKLFWHIDYLLASKACSITDVRYEEAPKKKECSMAQKLGEHLRGVSRFGSSDCGCSSHLFRLESAESLEELNQMKRYDLTGCVSFGQ